MSATVRLVDLRPTGWRACAGCVGDGADQFLPASHGSWVTPPDAWPCRSCPVRAECLTDAYIDVVLGLPGADLIGRGGLSGPAVSSGADRWKRTTAAPALRRLGADVTVIAGELRVSKRTVQRWFAAPPSGSMDEEVAA